jgi:mono/diheme cytochrome c family protein
VLATFAALGLPLASFADEPAAVRTEAKPAKPDGNTIFREQIVPFLQKHCLDCHGEDPEGDISFHQFKDVLAVANDQHTWERAIKMLRSGAMPPEDMDQPTDAERKKVVNWLEETVYNFKCDDLSTIDPGRVTIRRLNRAEYNSTVRDLLGVTFKPANDFPSDDVGAGFDNLGDVLTVPPLLMEKYLAAAERIAEESIVGDLKVFIESRYRDRNNLRGDGAASYDTSAAAGCSRARGASRAKSICPATGNTRSASMPAGNPARRASQARTAAGRRAGWGL